jgi:hypothetical protein
MGRRTAFTQAQVRRAVKAAESCGLRVMGVSVTSDGTITVHYSNDDNPPAATNGQPLASWDDFRRDKN